MSESHDTSSQDRKESRSLVRAGIGGLVFIALLLFLLWIGIAKTGRLDDIGSAACFVLPLALGACGVSAYCFFRSIQLRWPAKNDCYCRKCGFDLRGNTTGVCPECGFACEV